MTSRRQFFATAGALATVATTTATTAIAQSGGEACAVFTKDRQGKTTPDEALKRLKDGNERFTAGKTINCDLREQVKNTAGGQAPFAAIVGCIDSRVPPELVFDQRLGDVFAARIAGNFVNTDIIGSLEFATALAGAKLIVVLGHSDCGAVKGAVDDAKLGNLTATLANIRPAVIKIKDISGEQNSKNKKLVQAVADQNAKDAAAMLLSKSEVLTGLVKEGKLKIVSAMHDLNTGKVQWFA